MEKFRLLGKEEEHAFDLLDKLANGYPIDTDLDIVQSIRDTPEISIKKIKKHIDKCRSMKSSLGSRSYWIIGPSGFGKSQALYSLFKEIKSIGCDDEDRKIASVIVDFAPPKEISSSSDFQLEIFKRCTLASSTTKDTANSFAKKNIKKSGIGKETAETIVSLGLDIAFAIFKTTLPIVGTAMGFFAGLLLSRYRISKYFIRKKLIEDSYWEKNPDAMKLLIQWILFCYEPTYDRWQKLLHFAELLANNGQLLDSLNKILVKGGFSAIVILLDELSVLGKKEIPFILRMLRPENPDDKEERPSVVIAASVLPDIEQVFNSDEPLNRRFWKNSDKFRLKEPSINNIPGGDDDFDHCVSKIKALVGKITYAPKSDITDEQIIDLKSQLIRKLKEKKEKITWQDLWIAVCDLIAPWVRNP